MILFRKFVMRFRALLSSKKIMLFLTIASATTIAFQNCSRVNFSSADQASTGGGLGGPGGPGGGGPGDGGGPGGGGGTTLPGTVTFRLINNLSMPATLWQGTPPANVKTGKKIRQRSARKIAARKLKSSLQRDALSNPSIEATYQLPATGGLDIPFGINTTNQNWGHWSGEGFDNNTSITTLLHVSTSGLYVITAVDLAALQCAIGGNLYNIGASTNPATYCSTSTAAANGGTCDCRILTCRQSADGLGVGFVPEGYLQPNCSNNPANCSFPGFLGPILDGASITVTNATSVPFGQTCPTQQLTCHNGSMFNDPVSTTVSCAQNPSLCYTIYPADSCHVDGLHCSYGGRNDYNAGDLINGYNSANPTNILNGRCDPLKIKCRDDLIGNNGQRYAQFVVQESSAVNYPVGSLFPINGVVYPSCTDAKCYRTGSPIPYTIDTIINGFASPNPNSSNVCETKTIKCEALRDPVTQGVVATFQPDDVIFAGCTPTPTPLNCSYNGRSDYPINSSVTGFTSSIPTDTQDTAQGYTCTHQTSICTGSPPSFNPAVVPLCTPACFYNNASVPLNQRVTGFAEANPANGVCILASGTCQSYDTTTILGAHIVPDAPNTNVVPNCVRAHCTDNNGVQREIGESISVFPGSTADTCTRETRYCGRFSSGPAAGTFGFGIGIPTLANDYTVSPASSVGYDSCQQINYCVYNGIPYREGATLPGIFYDTATGNSAHQCTQVNPNPTCALRNGTYSFGTFFNSCTNNFILTVTASPSCGKVYGVASPTDTNITYCKNYDGVNCSNDVIVGSPATISSVPGATAPTAILGYAGVSQNYYNTGIPSVTIGTNAWTWQPDNLVRVTMDNDKFVNFTCPGPRQCLQHRYMAIGCGADQRLGPAGNFTNGYYGCSTAMTVTLDNQNVDSIGNSSSEFKTVLFSSTANAWDSHIADSLAKAHAAVDQNTRWTAEIKASAHQAIDFGAGKFPSSAGLVAGGSAWANHRNTANNNFNEWIVTTWVGYATLPQPTVANWNKPFAGIFINRACDADSGTNPGPGGGGPIGPEACVENDCRDAGNNSSDYCINGSWIHYANRRCN